MAKKAKQPDVKVNNQGSIFQFVLSNEKAKEWVTENVHIEPYMWQGDMAFCCEWRFARDIADGMIEAGLKVA